MIARVSLVATVIIAEFVVVPQTANNVAVEPVKVVDNVKVAARLSTDTVPAFVGETAQAGSQGDIPGLVTGVNVR